MRNREKKSADSLEISEVGSFFGRHNLKVERIPESSKHKTPDVLVGADRERFVVEVKAKERDEQLFDLMRKPRGTSTLYGGTSVETALRDGYRQLRDWPGRLNADYLLIWYWTASAPAPNIVAGGLKSMLYGMEALEGYTQPEGAFYQKPCFYFHHNLFLKWKELDAVVIENRGALELCVNNFSPRYAQFQSCSVYELFASTRHVTDPRINEQRGECFLLDSRHPRKNLNESVRVLRKKYSIGKPTIYRFHLVNFPLD